MSAWQRHFVVLSALIFCLVLAWGVEYLLDTSVETGLLLAILAFHEALRKDHRE